MPKEPTRIKNRFICCEGKQKFNLFTEANTILKKMLRSGSISTGRGRMSIYRCDICRKWHQGGKDV